MNKLELVKSMAQKTGLSEKKNRDALDAILNTFIQVVADGEAFNLAGFGTMKVTYRLPRVARNLQTGEVINIAARKAVVFTPSNALKEAVNQK
ncbi:MAG: HU family DNA-binding protein [Succinivibrionaceae bacterium]